MQFQLKIQLQDIYITPVWRTLIVPGHFNFDQLHEAIQAAFGWDNDHLYEFYSDTKIGCSPKISLPFNNSWEVDEDEDHNEYQKNSRKLLLRDLLKRKKKKISYIYDLGDNWVHTIQVEDILKTESNNATLIDGGGASPLENMGGPWGYMQKLEILSDPTHEEHEEIREWFGLEEGEKWEVEKFDLEKARRGVEKV